MHGQLSYQAFQLSFFFKSEVKTFGASARYPYIHICTYDHQLSITNEQSKKTDLASNHINSVYFFSCANHFTGFYHLQTSPKPACTSFFTPPPPWRISLEYPYIQLAKVKKTSRREPKKKTYQPFPRFLSRKA